MGQFLLSRCANKYALIALFIITFSQMTFAQHRLGLANSNYGGVTNLMSNPADIAGSRYKTYIGFGQTDVHFTNNYFKLSNVFKVRTDSVNFLSTQGDYLSAGFDFAGLSWIQRINSKGSFALSSRTRGTFQAVGVTPDLYSRFGDFVTTTTEKASEVKGGGINLSAQFFSELAASYAHSLIDNGETGLKVGATVKRLSGIYSTGVNASKLDAVYTKTTPTLGNYKIAAGQFEAAYVGAGAADSLSFSPADLFKSNGSGWGFDLGVTYELRSGSFTEDDGTTPYKLRVGIALTDFGSIKYSGSNVRYYTKDLKNANFEVDESVGIDNSDVLLRSLTINPDSFSQSFTSQIPTMLRLNADVRLSKNFFVNAYVAHSLADKYKIGTQYASYIAVTPRFETRYFDFSLPLALTNNYKTFAMGFGMRAGPVTLGMDNFTGFFGNPSGLSAHAGLNIGFGRAKSKALSEAEIAKQKEAEVAEAKNEAKEKAKKRSKKAPKEDSEPMKKTEVFAAPKPVEQPVIRPYATPEGEPEKPEMAAKPVDKTPQMPEKSVKEGLPKENRDKLLSTTPPKTSAVVVAPKPTVSTTPAKPQEMPAKAPATVATAPKPTVSTTPAKSQEMPKAPATVATAPKTTVSVTPAKPQEMPAKAPATVATAPKTNVSPMAAKPQEVPAKTGLPKENRDKLLSTTPSKTPAAAAVAPKPSVPMVAEKPAPIVLSPVGSGKMGECIEFYPNKAAISGNSLACLREISKFLLANKSIKLSVSGNVLSTDKVADPTSLKTERAKTIRNFLIQSGVEPARLTVKLTDNGGSTPVVLMPQ
jgi:outer membrane protein OmpA-like peptidoglycan-associated protein